jgi:hypothetical protein
VLVYNKLKITRHEHRGKLRPHEHTSYIPLAFLVFVVGLTLCFLTVSAYADHPPPQAGSISLTGAVPEPPPKTSANITAPVDQQHFATSPITVAGTCPLSTLVEIYKNNIFAGSIPCQASGNFSLQVDLLFGRNDLTAQVYDVLNQAGPVSKTVTVYYDSSLPTPAGVSSLNFSGSQLLLNTDAAFRGIFPGQQLNVPVTIIGGTPPFAINIQWGDGTNQVISQSQNSTFNATHTYKKAGTFKITLQATDSKQLVAFLTVTAVVNGQPAPVASVSTPTKNALNKLFVLWPIYAIAASVVVSFWLGERREKKIFNSNTKTQSPFGVIHQTTS